MSRPTRPVIDNGTISWDGAANDAHIQLYDRPAPIGEASATTIAALQAARDAEGFDQCIAWAWFGSAGTSGFVPVVSNGDTWVPISNWIAARKTLTSKSSVYTVLVEDDVIITTGAGSFDVTLPTSDDTNEGREVEFMHNGTGTITVIGTINGGASFLLTTQYDSITVRSNGAGGWGVVASAAGVGLINNFVDLADTPASLATHGLKATRVNAGATALEFIDLDTLYPTLTLLASVTTAEGASLVGIEDAAANFTGTDVEAALAELAGVSTFVALTDTPGSYGSGDALKQLRVNAAEDAVEFTFTIVPIIIAVGDESTPITIGTGKVSFRAPAAMTLTGIKASLVVAASAGTVTVDVHESGTTIMATTKLRFDATETTTVTYSGTAAALSDTVLAADAVITVDIDDAGSSADAAGLKVTLIGYLA